MKKTSFAEKLEYGVASLGDSVSYNFVGTFFLFFLTTIAGIDPATAGGIVAVGAVWNAIINPVMGYFADRVNTRFGRRRPMIFFFTVFLTVTLFLLFTDAGLPKALKPIYYGTLLMLFWGNFTGFFTPYSALGVDYASDYDERTSIRSFAYFFNMIGNMFCMVMPTLIVDFLQEHGMSESQAWSSTGAFLSTVTFISITITVIVSKARDLPCEKSEKAPRERHFVRNIFKEYVSIAKIRPMKYLVVASLMSLICYTIIMSDMLYFFTYNLGLSSLQISICLFARSFMGILFIPIAAKLAESSDKRISLMIFYAVGIIGMVVVKLIHIESFAGALLYTPFVMLCTAIYWQIMPAVFYDICDYDTMMTGKKREATILSFQGLVEALAAGIGGQILGVVLQIAGFNGNAGVQTSGALRWIENSATVVPILFLVVAVFALYRYPLRRSSHLMKK